MSDFLSLEPVSFGLITETPAPAPEPVILDELTASEIDNMLFLGIVIGIIISQLIGEFK